MARKRSLIELIEHFWLRVDTAEDCWLWTGELNNQGYGIYCIWDDGGRDRLFAHRFSALMAGMPVHSPKDVVMHQCDTPRCVRPSHLSVGTQADNIRDAHDKNRMNLDGLSAEYEQVCKECGKDFMGRPNRRYCSKDCERTVRYRDARRVREEERRRRARRAS